MAKDDHDNLTGDLFAQNNCKKKSETQHSPAKMDLLKAEELKREGMEAAALTQKEMIAELRAFARDHSLRFGSVTADDVRLEADRRDFHMKPPAFGSVFGKRDGDAGQFVIVDYHKSQNTKNHAHRYPVWKWI